MMYKNLVWIKMKEFTGSSYERFEKKYGEIADYLICGDWYLVRFK